MSTEPSPDTKETEQRLPFEPRTKRKKTAKAVPEPVASSAKTSTKKDQPEKTKPVAASAESMTVPEVVSKRMVRRMALLCGVPSVLGIATFFVSYFLVTQAGVKLPNVAVVLVSMGFFGLGVLGLSYGVLSASWDEDVPGTKLGWQEFTINLGRMTSAWRKTGQKD
jgi:Photosynthesis affected mutant 68